MRTDLGSTHGHQLSVMPSLLVSMGVYQVTCLAFLLTTAHAFKITGEDGEKICTLEKSKTNGDNCFYEPECEQVCKDIFVEQCDKYQETVCNNVTYPSCSDVYNQECKKVVDVKLVDDCQSKDVEVCNDEMKTICDNLSETVCKERTDVVNKDQCQFVVEQECLNLEKEKCKDFPELICEIGTAEKIVDKCEEVQDQQCEPVKVVMYFDEEKSLTETECRIVNTSSCNQEMVVKPKNISVTECGIVEEVKCLNGMDTRVEEECKVINQRICAPTTEEVKVVTEDSECVLTTGSECIESGTGAEATICESVIIEDCKNEQFDCLPGSTDPKCNSIDEYGAPQAPLLAQDSAAGNNNGNKKQCVPKTKQKCRKVNMLCAGNPGASCDNVAREIITHVDNQMCMDMPARVCRNVTHWGTKKECNPVEVERCGTVDKIVDTPVLEEVCRDTTKQLCEDVSRNIVISVPREVVKQKCSPVTQIRCSPVKIQVPERQCHTELKPVCTIAEKQKCFDVKREVCIPVEVEEKIKECNDEPVEKCRMETENVCRRETQEICKKVPKEFQKTVCKDVTKQVCVDAVKEECHQEERTNCYDIPGEPECSDVCNDVYWCKVCNQ